MVWLLLEWMSEHTTEWCRTVKWEGGGRNVLECSGPKLNSTRFLPHPPPSPPILCPIIHHTLHSNIKRTSFPSPSCSYKRESEARSKTCIMHIGTSRDLGPKTLVCSTNLYNEEKLVCQAESLTTMCVLNVLITGLQSRLRKRMLLLKRNLLGNFMNI